MANRINQISNFISNKKHIVIGLLLIGSIQIITSQPVTNETEAQSTKQSQTETTATTIMTTTTILPTTLSNDTTQNIKNTNLNQNQTKTPTTVPSATSLISSTTTESSSTTRFQPRLSTLPVNPDGSFTTCNNLTALDPSQQPITQPMARIRKCCPPGQNYQTINKTLMCAPETVPFDIPVIVAKFYQNCIEDLEQHIDIDYDIGYPCPGLETFVYNENYGDFLYVIQNGSLLRIDADFESYDVFNDYCLDMDRQTKNVTAMVCNLNMGRMVHVSKAQSYVYAICMLTSVPCLIVTAFCYLSIEQLRDLHGKSLACHSICLAMGFFILSVAQIRGRVAQTVGFVIQYFILACFFWLAIMCMDICVQVWYYIPKKRRTNAIQNLFRFIFYGILCQGLPLVLVLMSASKELPGMPSYYLKGITEATRSSQQYFIPPISTTLFICCILLIVSFFGFRELDPIVSKLYIYRKNIEAERLKVNLDVIDIEHYESVRQIAKSTAYLYTIMTLNWIFEIISFYVHTAEASLVLFDIMNALQGIVIFIIFVCLPQPLHIIKRWWMDRGSLDLDDAHNMTELETLQNGTRTNGNNNNNQ